MSVCVTSFLQGKATCMTRSHHCATTGPETKLLNTLCNNGKVTVGTPEVQQCPQITVQEWPKAQYHQNALAQQLAT
jgi:hypothetical protein